MKRVVVSVDGNGFAEASTECEIDQWQWRWEEDEFAVGGGDLTIQGELKDGHAGAWITVIAYKAKNEARGDRIGHDDALVGVLGEFRVNIEAPNPGSQIHVRYGCQRD